MLPAASVLPAYATSAIAADSAGEAAKGASLYRGCQAELRLMAPGVLPEAPQGDLVTGSYCVGYLNGFLANLSTAPAAICLADRPMADLVRAYVDYIDGHQQLLEQDKRIGLRMALESSFPCAAPTTTSATGGRAGSRTL